MAIINKTGIGEGNLIEAEHVTRAIDALSGGSTDSIVATGSFTGSFIGDGAGLTGITVTNATSASYAATASYLLGSIVSASYSDTSATASFVATASTAISASTANTASYIRSSTLNQNLTINGSLNISSSISNYAPRYITTTNGTTTDIYTFPNYLDGDALTIEASVLGISGSANLGNTGTVGGNFIGVFSQTDGIVGQSSSSFSSGFTAAGEPSYGLRYTGVPQQLKFFVKGLTNETINWTVSLRVTNT